MNDETWHQGQSCFPKYTGRFWNRDHDYTLFSQYAFLNENFKLHILITKYEFVSQLRQIYICVFTPNKHDETPIILGNAPHIGNIKTKAKNKTNKNIKKQYSYENETMKYTLSRMML